MKTSTTVIIAVIAASFTIQATGGPLTDIYLVIDNAVKKTRNQSFNQIQELVKAQLVNPNPDAYDFAYIAELMRIAGDPRADEYYKKAIIANPNDPGLNLLFGDYLRNTRGPQRPLVPEAEQQYREAVRKLAALDGKVPESIAIEETRSRVERGMASLYERDGVSLYSPLLGGQPTGPSFFFTTVDRAARAFSGLDDVHDIRNFTSEAVFSQSVPRLNRPLTPVELAGLVRYKDQWETFDRLRIRWDDFPTVDIVYRHHVEDNSEVTSFFAPNQFNRVTVDEYGTAAENTQSLGSFGDGFYRVGYSRLERVGLIEFLPTAKENVDQGTAELGFSRFLGPDKIVVDASYVYQKINQEIADPTPRDRNIIGGTVTYQLLRPVGFVSNNAVNRFTTRGIHFYAGGEYDQERYDATFVRRRDLYAGISFLGIGPVDLTFQPGWFDSSVSNDSSQYNSQYRADASLEWRIVDEERTPAIPTNSFLGLHPAFLHLAFPVRCDLPDKGLGAFESYKAGILLATKSIVMPFDKNAGTGSQQRYRGATILTEIRYDHQWFNRLGKQANLLSASFSLGF